MIIFVRVFGHINDNNLDEFCIVQKARTIFSKCKPLSLITVRFHDGRVSSHGVFDGDVESADVELEFYPFSYVITCLTKYDDLERQVSILQELLDQPKGAGAKYS